MANNTPSFNEFIDAIDIEVKKYNADWIGSIPFKFAPVCAMNNFNANDISYQIRCSQYLERDICQFLQSVAYNRLYFERQKYNAILSHDNLDPFKTDAFNMLRIDILKASEKSNSPLTCNGGDKGKDRTFCCKHNKRVRNQRVKERKLLTENGELYRDTSLIGNDLKNRRVDGRNKRRKTMIQQDEVHCPFGFRLSWDMNGFYICIGRKLNTFRAIHKYHPQFDEGITPVSRRLLSNQDKQTLKILAEACCGAAVGRNYIFSKLGKYISVNSVYNEAQRLIASDEKTDSSYDNLINYFNKQKDIKIQVLLDVPLSRLSKKMKNALRVHNDDDNDDASVSSNSSDATPILPALKKPSAYDTPTRIVAHTILNEKENYETDLTRYKELSPVRKMCRKRRIQKKVNTSSKLFISLAWVYKSHVRLVQLFPEVIHLDATSHSTRKKNVLLTFSVKLSNGKQFVFIRFWLQDQKRSSFRWVFQQALISLIPIETFERTQCFMADGDPQQTNEILGAIQIYAKNAVLGQCGWHIVHQGWRRHAPMEGAVFGESAKNKFFTLRRLIQFWIYSWMKPGYCETEEEYKISKKLLFLFLRSKVVFDICQKRSEIVDKFISFIRQYVIVYEVNYLFYLRKHKRFFDIAHNSAHEGTNFGAKEHSARMLPSLSMHQSAKRQNFQACLKVAQILAEYQNEYSKKKSWSTLPTAKHIVSIAEGILYDHYKRDHNYAVAKIQTTLPNDKKQLFEVKFVSDGSEFLAYHQADENLYMEETAEMIGNSETASHHLEDYSDNVTATTVAESVDDDVEEFLREMDPDHPSRGDNISYKNVMDMYDNHYDIQSGEEEELEGEVIDAAKYTKHSRKYIGSKKRSKGSGDSRFKSTDWSKIVGLDEPGDLKLTTKTPIPLFSRVRCIEIDEQGITRCSCKHFERTGLPCIHIHSLYKYIDPDWKGFTRQDVSFRWWILYAYHGFKDNSSISKLFSKCIEHDIPGPSLSSIDINKSASLPIHDTTANFSAWERVHNYIPEKKNLIAQRLGWKNVEIENMSQEEHDGATIITVNIEPTAEEEPNHLFDEEDVVYHEDIHDATKKGPLRSVFNDIWNECCSVHDHRFDLELRKELHELLTNHISKVNQHINTPEENSNSTGMVGLSQGELVCRHRTYAGKNCS